MVVTDGFESSGDLDDPLMRISDDEDGGHSGDDDDGHWVGLSEVVTRLIPRCVSLCFLVL